MQQKCVFIHQITEPEYAELYGIVRDPEIAKWLGQGEIWTSGRLLELRNWSAKDYTQPWSARTYFYWAILAREDERDWHCVGIVGLHPAPRALGAGLQFMIAIAPGARGRGHASRAIRDILALDEVKRDNRAIYALVRADNDASLRLFARVEALTRAHATARIGRAEYVVFARNAQ
jgi:RimJ/RimL family protein N-acetyltransferase